MSDFIDLKSHSVSIALNLLLKDRTTEKNIIFATDAYHGIAFTLVKKSNEDAAVSSVRIVGNSAKSEGTDHLEMLKKLATLHDAGILTDDEFAAKKAEILSRI